MTYRAVVFDAHGGPEVLHTVERPDPVVEPGHVVVRVRATGVQPFDCKFRRGAFQGFMAADFPHCLGSDFAGVVDAVGDGVGGFDAGDHVLGYCDRGAHAELVVVPAEQLMARPPMIDWEVAGALSASGQTAYNALRDLGVSVGETVLVHAAAGGVGTVAVQLAREWGATVIGTASPANHDHLRALGVEPIAYGPGLVDRVRAVAPGGVDVAFDCVGGEAVPVSVDLVADRSRIGTIADFGAVAAYGVRRPGGERSATTLAELVRLHTAGRLNLPIQAAFPLAAAADAHRLVETGHVRGKVVLVAGP